MIANSRTCDARIRRGVRELGDEGRAVARRAVEANRPTMTFDDRSHDREPESRTARGASWIRLLELAEDATTELQRNSGTRSVTKTTTLVGVVRSDTVTVSPRGEKRTAFEM